MPSIPFKLHVQAHSDWCWLAAAEGVVRYLNGRFVNLREAPSQCELASRFVQGDHGERLDCCGRGVARACNSTGFIEKVLNPLGIPAVRRRGKLTFEQVQKTISAGLPIIARIGWNDGGGHIVVIYGWYKTWSGKPQVEVRDPLFPDSVLDYRRFAYHYQRVGRWTHTIHLRLNPGVRSGSD